MQDCIKQCLQAKSENVFLFTVLISKVFFMYGMWWPWCTGIEFKLRKLYNQIHLDKVCSLCMWGSIQQKSYFIQVILMYIVILMLSFCNLKSNSFALYHILVACFRYWPYVFIFYLSANCCKYWMPICSMTSVMTNKCK